MRIKLSINEAEPAALAGVADAASAAALQAVTEATETLKLALRDQVTGAGLGQRLANSWRSRVFANQGRSPAGMVTSTAPHIIQAFDEGPTIVARNGSRWLAIPTEAVPRHPRGRRMSPVEVEAQFNRDLRLIPARTGRAALLVMDQVVAARSGRGVRPATERRLAQGRKPQPVLMFVLVPQVTLPKLLDLDAAVAEAERAFPDLVIERLEGER